MAVFLAVLETKEIKLIQYCSLSVKRSGALLHLAALPISFPAAFWGGRSRCLL